jgi:hypothetical protein
MQQHFMPSASAVLQRFFIRCLHGEGIAVMMKAGVHACIAVYCPMRVL